MNTMDKTYEGTPVGQQEQAPTAGSPQGSTLKKSAGVVNYEQGRARLAPPGGGMGQGTSSWVQNVLHSVAKKGKSLVQNDNVASPGGGGGDQCVAETVPPKNTPSTRMPEDPATGWGAVVGNVHGVEVRKNLVSNLGALQKNVPGVDVGATPYETTLRTTYGYSYQCVELVNRYFAQCLGHYNMIASGHAKAYLGTGDRGLETHRRGSATRPQSGDLMVDVDGGGGYGHVGIVKTATESQIEVAQQNTSNPIATTSLTKKGEGWEYGVWDGFRRKPGVVPNENAGQSKEPRNAADIVAEAFGLENIVTAFKSGKKVLESSLKRGDKGVYVDGLQRALVKAEFMTEAVRITGPGIFGPKTEKAVIDFQTAAGLAPTGIADAKTLFGLSVYRTPEQKLQDDILRDKQTSADRQKTVADLGQVSGFGDELYRKAGSMVDALVPTVGDDTSLELAFNVPIVSAPGAKWGLWLKGEATRETGSGVRLGVKLGGAFTGEVDMYVIEAFARAEVYGWLEAFGDDGYETMRLLSYSLEDRIRSVSDRAADAVWGKGFGAEVQADMDKDDYVTSGGGMSFEAGVGAIKKPDSIDFNASGEVDRSWGTRLTKDGKKDEQRASVALNVDTGKWSGEGKYEEASVDGSMEHTLSLAPRREVDITEFATEMADPARAKETLRGWAFEVIGTVHGVIMNRTGLIGNGAQKMGAIVDSVRSLDPSQDFLVDQAILIMAKKVKAIEAVKMGQRLNINLKWSTSKQGWDAELTIDLDQVRSLQIGEDERSPLYAKIEDIANLLHAGPISFGPGV